MNYSQEKWVKHLIIQFKRKLLNNKYFQFIFSMLPPDFSNQPTNNKYFPPRNHSHSHRWLLSISDWTGSQLSSGIFFCFQFPLLFLRANTTDRFSFCWGLVSKCSSLSSIAKPIKSLWEIVPTTWFVWFTTLICLRPKVQIMRMFCEAKNVVVHKLRNH